MVETSVAAGGVSVVMPAYNAEPYIARAVESVLDQSFGQWELIVVDDGSTDRTRDVATAYQDSRIAVLHQSNAGESSARNRALDRMRGEYVAFLDADDEWLPDHLEAAVGHLRAHPDHAGVYTDGYHITESGRRLTPLSSRRRGPMTGRVFSEAVRGSDLFGPPVCVVLRTEPIRRLRLRFDEEIVIGPDWDFLVRFADEGTFGYVDRATCLYRVHSANITARVGLERRALELAKCRTNAIRMRSFPECPLDVRFNVFHDLLVNLLREDPVRQEAVTQWPQFADLPSAERARLLRLMSSKAILFEHGRPFVRSWLERAWRLNRADWRAALLLAGYRASPRLCRQALRLRAGRQGNPVLVPPFADLDTEKA